MELPKTFETFLLGLAGLLFYLAYQHSTNEALLWFGIVFGIFLIFLAVALWYWRTKEYLDYLGRQL